MAGCCRLVTGATDRVHAPPDMALLAFTDLLCHHTSQCPCAVPKLLLGADIPAMPRYAACPSIRVRAPLWYHRITAYSVLCITRNAMAQCCERSHLPLLRTAASLLCTTPVAASAVAYCSFGAACHCIMYVISLSCDPGGIGCTISSNN